MNTVNVFLAEKINGEWKFNETTISSINDIKEVIAQEPDEAYINDEVVAFYTVKASGIDAKVKDMNETRHYMSSPILVVRHNDVEPIDINDSVIQNIKETIDFC